MFGLLAGLTQVQGSIPETNKGSGHCFVWHSGLDQAHTLLAQKGTSAESRCVVCVLVSSTDVTSHPVVTA